MCGLKHHLDSLACWPLVILSSSIFKVPFKPNYPWKGWSVNNRLYITAFTVAPPNRLYGCCSPECTRLTLHLPWCSCNRPDSGRSRTSPRGTPDRRGRNSSGALAVLGGCRESEIITASSSSSSSPRTYKTVQLRGWNSCSPSGATAQPKLPPHWHFCDTSLIFLYCSGSGGRKDREIMVNGWAFEEKKNAPDERVVVHDDQPPRLWCRAAEESLEDRKCFATVSCKQRQACRMASSNGWIGALFLFTEIN